MGKKWNQRQISWSWDQKSLRIVTAAMKLKDTMLGRKAIGKVRQLIKKQRPRFSDKGPSSQSHGFPVVTHGCES